MYAVSAAAVAVSAAKIKKPDLSESKIPLMAVSGAMVFAAQMINFTIPATGSSGHIGGGILLAAMLGPYAGLLALAAVLIIQCLCFADGGLLALGCNIFNMGVIPCLLAYPLVFKTIAFRKNPVTASTVSEHSTGSAKQSKSAHFRITIASVIAVILALQIGAFGVVLETSASGIAELPLSSFIILMQPIHLAIGVVEGIVTAAILNFIYAARPEILTNAAFPHHSNAVIPGSDPGSSPSTQKKSMRPILIVLASATLITAIALSLLASANPDGLEWSIGKITGQTELDAEGRVFSLLSGIQERLSFMPDYDFKSGSGSGTSVAGIVGGALTFALAGAAGLCIHLFKRKRRTEA
jgi:cobalt/nickel transport system permease protein